MKMILLLIFSVIANSLAFPPQEGGTKLSIDDVDKRIIGGLMAGRSQFPYIVAIYIRTDAGTFFCAGALLNTQWVVTAGHCVYGAVSFTIYLGSYSLSEDESDMVKVVTDLYVLYPEYNPNTLENDIALIELPTPITYNDYIQPVNMLPGAPLQPNSPLTIMGWGQMSDSDTSLQNRILYTTVTTISNDQCRIYYGNQIVDSMVCAAKEYTGGICYGDTGGPLIQYISRLQVMLVGIASFISQNGCESPEPSGYTRVQIYADWIRNITGFS